MPPKKIMSFEGPEKEKIAEICLKRFGQQEMFVATNKVLGLQQPEAKLLGCSSDGFPLFNW